MLINTAGVDKDYAANHSQLTKTLLPSSFALAEDEVVVIVIEITFDRYRQL
jgi:hypothetical protein